MSMPHVCKCGTCGKEMGWPGFPGLNYNDPKMTAAAHGPDLSTMKTYETCASCGTFHERGAACGIEVL